MSEPQQNPVDEIGSEPNGRASPATHPAHSASEPRSPAQVCKDIALFLGAPFITIAYLALFPFIGLRMLIRTGSQARHHRNDVM